jgi:anti-sigma regulatory factor (Ser/Thr protein kinase)
LQIVLKNKPEEKLKLLAALDEFAREKQLPKAALQAADLALEEHLTNIMNYAYSTEGDHQIEVRLEVEHGIFLVEVSDDGQPFDPLLKPDVDVSAPLEGRPIGGLGIHLMRRFMDQLNYRREAGKNILTMKKKIE